MITATRAYIDALATALTNETGIRIQEGKGWSADVKHRILIYDYNSLSQLSPESAKGLILHEIGHLLHTTSGKPTELEKTRPAMHEVYNAIEDIRIERLLERQYGEFAKPLETNRQLFTQALPQETDTRPPALLRQILTTIMDYNGSGTKYYKKITPQAMDYVTKLAREGLLSISSDIDTTEEVKRLCDEKLYPVLKPIIDAIKEPDESIAPRKKGAGAGMTESKSVFHSIPTDTELEAMLQPYINTLAQQLSNILKERRATRFNGGKRTGKLLNKDAYKVLTDETRIFSRKTTPNAPDYNIILCLDESGSMEERDANGKRHPNAYIGAFLIDRVFKKLGSTTHYVIFNQHARKADSLAEYRDFNGGGNDDDGALRKAYKALDETRENIVFMFSDGQICTDVAEIVKDIRKTSTLVGIGVGIDTDELRNAYGDAINVPDVSKLPQALIQKIKQLIHR